MLFIDVAFTFSKDVNINRAVMGLLAGQLTQGQVVCLGLRESYSSQRVYIELFREMCRVMSLSSSHFNTHTLLTWDESDQVKGV